MAIYLRNKDLLSEFQICKEKGELTRNMTQMFILLVKRISRKFHYQNAMDREDTEGQALYQLCKNWHKFNPERSDNPFAFYTQVAKMGFAQGFNQLHPATFRGGKVVSFDRVGPSGESNHGMI